MSDYNKMASGVVSSLGGATPVILPFTPSYIEISNATRAGNAGVNKAWWQVEMPQASAFLTTTSSGTPNTDTTTYVTSNGFTTFQAAQALQYGASLNISTVTKASAAVVTTSSNHNLVSGDVVILQNLYQSATSGMIQICGIPFVVTVTGATTFTIPWNTNQSNYTAYNSGSASVQATVKQVLYPVLYAPGASYISAISLGSSTTVNTSMPHNFQVGQEVAFRIPASWGTTQLNSLPNIIIPGSPVYGYVTAVNSSTQVVVNINSSAYTAFNSNQPFGFGFSFPTIVAVGDNNSGSLLSGYAGPSVYLGNSTGATTLMQGPVIAGAYINATYQGFIIGSAAAGTSGDTLYYRAYFHDIV